MFEIISICIAAVSLLISIFAFCEAHNARKLNFRNIKAEKLDKYGKELRKIQDETGESLKRLRYEAFQAFSQIGKYIDRFSGTATKGRPTRHILYDLYVAFFDDSIAYVGQNAPFIWHRLEVILSLDEQHEILKPNAKMLEAYKILLATIPEKERQDCIDNIMKLADKYCTENEKIEAMLEEKIKLIDQLVLENEHEEFKINESEGGRRLLAEKIKYQELLLLGLKDVKAFVESDRSKPEGWQLRESIYVVIILCIVSKYQDWGCEPNLLLKQRG